MTWVAFFILLFIVLVLFWVLPKIDEYRATINLDARIAEAEGALQWLWLKVQGLKTVIVLGVGSFAAIAPDVLREFSGIDLSPLIGANWGAKVTAAMSLLATVSHISGLLAAARAEPVKDDAQ